MIVLGNKIDDTNYISLHFLITVVGFSIYKSYYIISEQKTKYIDVHIIFVALKKKIKKVFTLINNKLLLSLHE